MARGVNKVIAIGHLGGDPETRYVPSGAAVTTFGIAVSESWKDKATGETKESTEWINCEAWGKLAEICAEYLRKGSQVYVEGKFKTDKWEDKDSGQTRSKVKVRVDQMQMLGGKTDGARPPVDRTQPPEKQEQPDFDDDIPF